MKRNPWKGEGRGGKKERGTNEGRKRGEKESLGKAKIRLKEAET